MDSSKPSNCDDNTDDNLQKTINDTLTQIQQLQTQLQTITTTDATMITAITQLYSTLFQGRSPEEVTINSNGDVYFSPPHK